MCSIPNGKVPYGIQHHIPKCCRRRQGPDSELAGIPDMTSSPEGRPAGPMDAKLPKRRKANAGKPPEKRASASFNSVPREQLNIHYV